MAKVRLVVKKYTFAKVNAKRRKNKLPPLWWIEGLPYEECRLVRCGPYTSYAEAKSDQDGMQLVFDNADYTGVEEWRK